MIFLPVKPNLGQSSTARVKSIKTRQIYRSIKASATDKDKSLSPCPPMNIPSRSVLISSHSSCYYQLLPMPSIHSFVSLGVECVQGPGVIDFFLPIANWLARSFHWIVFTVFLCDEKRCGQTAHCLKGWQFAGEQKVSANVICLRRCWFLWSPPNELLCENCWIFLCQRHPDKYVGYSHLVPI